MLPGPSFRPPERRPPAPSHPGLLTATVVRHSHPAVMATNRRDSAGTMNQHRQLDAPRVRLLAAIVRREGDSVAWIGHRHRRPGGARGRVPRCPPPLAPRDHAGTGTPRVGNPDHYRAAPRREV